MSLIGRAKDFSAIPNLPCIISKEGFQNVNLSYIGGMWVLYEFDSLASKEKFLNHFGIGSWCTELIQATNSFENDERIVWISIEGLPIKAWTPNTFRKIASLWGEYVEWEDADLKSLSCKHLCLKTNMKKMTKMISLLMRNHKKVTSRTKMIIMRVMLIEYQNRASSMKTTLLTKMSTVAKNERLDHKSEDPFNIYGILDGQKNNDYLRTFINRWEGDTVIIGDFNEVRSEHERFGSTFNRQGAIAFNNFISSACLIDLPLEEGVLDLFPHLSALCLDRHLSDHRPIFLRETNYDYGPSLFWFFHSWFAMEGFNSFMETTWKSLNIAEPNGLIQLKKKLQALKIVVKAWSKEIDKRFKIWSVLLLMKRSKGVFEIVAPANHLILDGSFILNELLSWCKFKRLNGMIFKVDFEKAFDSVKWDYLDETLKAFGFGSKWRYWISICLNNAMGSVLINRSPTLEIQFHKGLKQGLKINLHKRKLMRIGVGSNVVATTASLIGCSLLTAPFNYLGVKVDSNMRPPFLFKAGCHLDSALSYVYIQGSNWRVKLFGIYSLEFFYGVDGSDRKLAWIGWNMVLTSKKNDGALDTHKLIPIRSPWQDVILAIHSLQSKGEVALKVLHKRLYALEICKSISVAKKMGHPSLSHSFCRIPRGSQEFSVKSSRILINNTILPKAEVPTRWLRVVPIKVNVHAWRVCLDKLPTKANLSLRGMDIPSIACPLCNSAVESSSHIFSLVYWLAKFGENL
nr:RNA-directed DNA polymerase, eukaryota [Tanacetum cinerariifolium]